MQKERLKGRGPLSCERGPQAWSWPISRILSPVLERTAGWPSICDERCRSPVATYPGVVERATRPLLGLAPDGVCLAAPVTRHAGELLPHRFTLTGEPYLERRGSQAVCFLLHFPRLAPPGTFTSVLPYGVRTFLDRPRPAAATRPAPITSTIMTASDFPAKSELDELARPDVAVVSPLPQEHPDNPSMGDHQVRPGSQLGDELVHAFSERIHRLTTGGLESTERDEFRLHVGRVVLETSPVQVAEIEFPQAAVGCHRPC